MTVAPVISCAELLMRLGDDDVLVLMIRERERMPRRIPGALEMSLDELERDRHVLPDDELIVLCGASGDGSDAEQAWSLLSRSHPRVVCLLGGEHAWFAGGFPAETRRGEGWLTSL